MCSLSALRALSVPGIFYCCMNSCPAFNVQPFGFAGIIRTWYFYCCMNSCPAFNMQLFRLCGHYLYLVFLLLYEYLPCFQREAFRLCGHYLCLVFQFIVVQFLALFRTWICGLFSVFIRYSRVLRFHALHFYAKPLALQVSSIPRINRCMNPCFIIYRQ